MSQHHYPGSNQPPPYYNPPQWPPPPPQAHLYPPHSSGPPPEHAGPYAPYPAVPGYPYYVPMMAVPVGLPPPPGDQPNPTYITNYIYHGEASNQPAPPLSGDAVQIVENSGDFDWIPTTSTTASHLSGKAVLGGHEGWDGSPLWVIRAWHNGDLIPGKLSVRHNSASIMYNGKEVPVQNIEVLCARPENLRWVPASNGDVPPGAIDGGKTASGEVLYVGRARYQLSITPGKIQPSHNCCYIGFGGSEVSHRVYDVLCRIS